MPTPEHDLDDLPGSGLPLRTTAIVLYVTLALLALVIPEAAVNRLKDFTPNTLRDTALVAAQAIVSVAQTGRLDRPYQAGRRLFLTLTGKTED